MAASTRLEEYRTTVRQQVLPAYDRLGSLTLVYLLGSLVAGYADDADLDMMLVWDDPDVPTAAHRELLIAHFDERERGQPFVLDYHDIDLERFVIADLEYNLAHLPLAVWQAMIQAILDGQRAGSERVLQTYRHWRRARTGSSSTASWWRRCVLLYAPCFRCMKCTIPVINGCGRRLSALDWRQRFWPRLIASGLRGETSRKTRWNRLRR